MIFPLTPVTLGVFMSNHGPDRDPVGFGVAVSYNLLRSLSDRQWLCEGEPEIKSGEKEKLTLARYYKRKKSSSEIIFMRNQLLYIKAATNLFWAAKDMIALTYTLRSLRRI